MLSINNISKTFNIGTINEKQALDGVNLFVNEGDIIRIDTRTGEYMSRK